MRLAARLSNRFYEANMWISRAADQFQRRQYIAPMLAPINAIWLGANVVAATVYAILAPVATIIIHAFEKITLLSKSFFSLFKTTSNSIKSSKSTEDKKVVMSEAPMMRESPVKVENRETIDSSLKIDNNEDVEPLKVDNQETIVQLKVDNNEAAESLKDGNKTDAIDYEKSLQELELSKQKYLEGTVIVVPGTRGIFSAMTRYMNSYTDDNESLDAYDHIISEAKLRC